MPTVDSWSFYFWTMWLDDKRQTWVHRHDFATADEARRAHRLARAFDWRKQEMREPMVTGLYAVAAGIEREIEPSVRFGEQKAAPNPPAPWHAG